MSSALLLALAIQAGASVAPPAPADASPGLLLCGEPVPPPAALPADGSPPVLYMVGLCFGTPDNTSVVDPETYMFHLRVRPSRPSQNEWVSYDSQVRDMALADFKRLLATGFLDDLKIEVDDYVFANGVVGKVMAFRIEERARVRTVNYETGDVLDRGKIEETLRERQLELRTDAFLDDGTLRRITGVLREMLAEKGFVDGSVTHHVTATPEPKFVNVVFHVSAGPRVAIRDVEFVGNRAMSDVVLAGRLSGNRAQHLFSFLSGGGVFNDAKYEEDAQRIEDYYRDHGFVEARVSRPELRRLDDAPDGSTRWVQLRIPVSEGRRFRLGTVSFEGNQSLPTAGLQALFKLKPGDWYRQQAFRDGLNKARELYGAAGYMEFTGFPELTPREVASGEPIMDVLVRVVEGPKYFVNRLSFTGNVTTHDRVIRREFQIVEGGPFNTEALKYSIQRLNQLGYFKPLEGNASDLQVEKTPGRSDAVDLTVKVEEQNRNQISFGAGVSQYEGIFGNLSYTTSNFLGRGESVTIAAQQGSRSTVYQLAFSEPYIFDRAIAGGIDLYSRKNDFLTGDGAVGYSEVRSGLSLSIARPVFRFSRLAVSYGYEVIDVAASQEILNSLDSVSGVGVPVFNPYLDEGRHTESRVTPAFILNSVDNPLRPRRGRKISVTLPITGGPFGGTTNYVKPELEAVQYVPVTARTGLGVRASGGMVRAFGSTNALPYYVRYFLGGETQIRGVDLRSVGPTDKDNRAIGGDRFVLFNAEYYFDWFGPVRALAFHDAGQAYAENQSLALSRLRTSSGVELRFMMPVLNVPFRLIYSWNLYRDTYQPPRGFRFAVGTTF